MTDTVVTQSQAPWSGIQDYLTAGFDRAEGLYQQGGPQYYGGSTVSGFGADTTAAMDMFRDTAMQGSGVPQAATGQLQGTLQGDYLNSNPYLDAMYNSAAGRVTDHYQEAVAPSIAAQYGLSGRTGSNAAFANSMQNSQLALGDSLASLSANIYGTNYQQERDRQMQAAGLSPSVAPMSYYDASQLMNIGGMQDQKDQQFLTDDVNRWNFEQNRPYDNLGRYMGYLGGNYGSEISQPFDSTAYNLGLLGTGIGIGDELLGGTSYGSTGGLLGSILGF